MTCQNSQAYYWDHYEKHLAYARKRYGGEAVDLLHTVLINFCERDLSHIKDKEAYLYQALRMAHDLSNSDYRRQQAISAELPANLPGDNGIDPLVIMREGLELYSSRLAQLDRAIFRAHYDSEVSVNEIVRCLEIPQRSVYHILTRSRKAIKNALNIECSVC